MSKNKVGRPTVFTQDVLNKLQQAFLKGYSNRAACIYADVVEGTFYKYCDENPEYVEKKKAWQENPVSKSRDVVYDAIDQGDVQTAKWMLERKCKDEFSLRTEQTGIGGGPIKKEVVYIDKEEKEGYEEHINKTINGD